MKELNTIIRRDTISGSSKIIVGDKFSDLVLETLGKVYIKSGRQLKLLSDIAEKVSTTSDIKNKTIIVNSTSELENLEYPGEGYFIFNKTTGILYISLNNRYIALLNASEFSESGYVKKSGDTMTGPLEIKSNDANLIISSNKLIKNLNSSYLNGYTDLDFAKRNKDEKINGNWNIEGKWNFNKPTVFNENIRSKKDYITDGNLSSPEFASGFSGYGWRLDASTNTFTIDNLVVRKLMMVYEMVINKITATNGSLWVSNASKIESVKQVRFIYPDNTKYVKDSYSIVNVEEGFDNNEYYLFGESKSVTGENIASSTNIPENGIDKFRPIRLQYLNNAGSNIINFPDSGIIIEDENSEIYDINNSDLLESSFSAEVEGTDIEILTYYKYFAAQANPNVNNCYVIETDKEEYPMFRDGDILRCQKYTEGNIKYYDVVVLKHIKERHYLIQVAESVFDKYTKVEYDEEGNLINTTEEYNETLYNKTNKVLNPSTGEYVYKSKSYENADGSYNGESSLYKPQKGDDLIHIGNIYNTDRQGALYLTATDDQGPYMDILDGINRPDYSVLYKTGDNEYNKPTKVRLGKLDGIYNPIFKGNQPKGYGLYGENVYLTGEFHLNNGKSVADFEENITLAVGNSEQALTEINIIKEQLEDFNTSELVKNSDLESAGMALGDNAIILWADAIKIATEKADMDNPNKYTALFSDGKLSAQVFEAVAYTKEGYNSDYELVIDNICRPLVGYTGNNINNPIIGSLTNNSYEDDILSVNFNNKLVFKKLSSEGYDFCDVNGALLSSNDSFNPIPDNITSIQFGNTIYSKENYNFYAPNEHFYQENPYPVLTINKLGKGEMIYYYPSGYIMNCKVFKNSYSQISGCIEYFFNNYICTLDDVKGGYDLLKLKYSIEGNGCVKIIDYFKEEINDITLHNAEFYKWYVWDSSYDIYLGPYTTVNKLSNSSKDIPKIAQRCINKSEKFSLYYIRDLEKSGNFTYNDITYNVKNYLYNSLECSNCIASILTNGITSELFTEWQSYIDLSDLIVQDTNDIESTDTTQCFIKSYTPTSLTMIPTVQGKQPIADLLDHSIAVFYMNNSITPIE